MLIYRPFSGKTNSWRLEQFHVITENGILENVHCVKIQSSPDGGKTLQNFWVDPSRGDLVVALEELNSQRQPTADLSIRYRHDNKHGWVPATWTASRLHMPREEFSVIDFTINEPIPAPTFDTDFPSGTIIFDKRTDRHYVAVAQNSRPSATKLHPVPIQQVLAANVNFELDPQPLRKALAVVHRRCDVDIVIDEPALKSAQIDLSTAVEAKLKGKTVRDLISHLLKQCPKPVGSEVQNDVLVIKPGLSK